MLISFKSNNKMPNVGYTTTFKDTDEVSKGRRIQTLL